MTFIMKNKEKIRLIIFSSIYFLTIAILLSTNYYFFKSSNTSIKQINTLSAKEIVLKKDLNHLTTKFSETEKALIDLQNQDQLKINQNLTEEIKNINTTYNSSVKTYENLLDLKSISKKTENFDKTFAEILSLLSEKNYISASALLAQLDKDIKTESDKISSSFVIPQNVKAVDAAPGSGYSQQKVTTDVGDFLVDVLAADLNSTRVMVDTASDSTCGNDCPVLSLSTFISRSGGFAGINGPYFCPASYPACSGKKNSFDTLLMNKNKVYFNSDNNIYSNVPAVIFTGNSARFVGASSQWGRDTGVDAVIASQPMLLSGGNVTFSGDSESKRASKGNRSFIGNKGNTVYIGVVHNASVYDVAQVLKKMGLENALNLDSGGSTAFYTNGHFVAGPGRDLPFGIVLVHK